MMMQSDLPVASMSMVNGAGLKLAFVFNWGPFVDVVPSQPDRQINKVEISEVKASFKEEVFLIYKNSILSQHF